MIKIYVLLFLITITVCTADQQWWQKIQRLMCMDDNGTRIQVTDNQLANVEIKCDIDKNEEGPVKICSNKQLDTSRAILEEFCNPGTFACIEKQPLLDSFSAPEELKQQLIDCIETALKA